MRVVEGDDSLIVDISDALSERDRVRFTVHTRTKLAQFAKPVLSVVRQHEEFIWLHDCLEDNDKYAGYIIPPAPPKPDFDASREKLQRLGDGEANMTKEEFAKMKQELEAEYLAIFKKTVAMHEIFLQRLAAHKEFRLDNNFKIFLEYENELAVRCKNKKERLAGSISNLGKSLTDFVITTSQVAATTSASTSILAGHSQIRHSLSKQHLASVSNQSSNNISSTTSTTNKQQLNGNISTSDITSSSSSLTTITNHVTSDEQYSENNQKLENSNQESAIENQPSANVNTTDDALNFRKSNTTNIDDNNVKEEIDEQYFEKERLFLALYYNSIRETAIQSDKVVQLQKCVADSYQYIAQQLVKLASVEVVPITSQTKDPSSFVSCPLPSLALPNPITPPPASTVISNNYPSTSGSSKDPSNSSSSSASSITLSKQLINKNAVTNDDDKKIKASIVVEDDEDDNDDLLNSVDLDSPILSRTNMNNNNNNNNINNIDTDNNKSDMSKAVESNNDKSIINQDTFQMTDYLEQARKIETRIAADEDLKLTDLFLYYKRDTVAAQDLLTRRKRFLNEYEIAKKNLEKARQKGRTQMQYADVIQKQAKENFLSISKLAQQELIDYKQRRVASFKRAFADLVQLELKHLHLHSQLITKCLNTYRSNTN